MKFQKVLVAFILCSAVYFFPRNIFSDDIQKANKYYEKYDYKLALAIYETIMLKKPSLEVAQKLANCYRFINDSEGAEQAYSRVLTFSGFDPINYKYYADALKQNGRFDEARQYYLLLGEKVPAMAEDAKKMANSCDVARMWFENPDKNVQLKNDDRINSEYSDFCPVMSNNSIAFVSDRWFVEGSATKKNVIYGWTGNPYLKIYQLKDDKVTILPKVINAEFHNGPAVFSSKGDTIFFTRTTLAKKKKKSKDLNVGKKTIWYSVKKGENWAEPVQLNLCNSDLYSCQHPALSPKGDILYFASDMQGGLGGMDLYAVKKQPDGSWGTPVNCGNNINSKEDDVFPSVRFDGKLYFSSKGNVGMGGLDLFTADGSYDSFTAAENLKAPMNSLRDDFGVWFEDEFTGYLSSNRRGGKGLDDIYRFHIVPTTAVFAIEGEVVDKEKGKPLSNVNIILTNKNTGAEISTISDLEGKFNFNLEPNTSYIVSGDKSKYYSRQEGEISTMNLKESTIFNVKFELERAEDAYIVHLNNIYYDFNKWNIRPDAKPELNKVVSFLSTMPDVNIELRSHTDSRGTAVYNKKLSQKRAQSAVDYLVNQGVGSKRLSAVGLGETEILNRCADGVKCTEKEHQANRRTEFKVVKINPVARLPLNNVTAKAN
ncbi:OmpA family protein [Rubrolithibacter danxiaensis]|uniref:OmpA family protein n=1 Tax=Rubrolithibacter danxiaensis TaxID=3390805 RepID=UPI003BF7BC2F